MRRLPAISAALGFLVVAPVLASAQAPPVAVQVAALRDSLQTADAAAVGQLRADAAGAGPATAGALRLALLERRLAEVTGAPTWLDSAERRLEGVLAEHDDWGEAWHELALVKLALHDAGRIVKDRRWQRAGTDYLHVAVDLLLRALAADSGNVPAATTLGTTVLRQTVQPQLALALPWVRRAAAIGGDASIHRVRGTIERELAHADSAVEAFRTYVAVGGDPALGRLEIVRTLLPLGRSAWAESLYYEGAELASDRAAAQYRWDIAWIATEDELAAFDSVSARDGAERAAMLRKFWLDRDVADARGEGERLTEHYRRLDYALRHFRRPVEPRQTSHAAAIGSGNSPVGGLRAISGHSIYILGNDGIGTDHFQDQRSVGQHIRDMGRQQSSAAGYARLTARSMLGSYTDEQMLLDHRGVIYLRHGEPHERATFGGYDVGANESWKYVTPEGTMILHFVGTTQASDLVEQLELNPQLFESRARLDPRYERMAQGLGLGGGQLSLPPHVLQEDRERGQKAIEASVGTDTHVLRFERALQPVVQAFGVRPAGAATGALLVVFAAPAGGLTPARFGSDSVIAYPMRFRLIVQRADGEVIRVDTTRVYATRRVLDDEEFVTGQLSVPARAGEYRMTVVLGDGEWSAGAQTRIGGLHVPGAEPLALSDLVLGRTGSGQVWEVGGASVPLNPLNTYREGGSVEVYYQMRGLDPGATYRTSIEVRPRNSARNDPSVRVAFDDDAGARDLDVSRTIGLGRLRRGEYVLTVTVTGPDGRSAQREQFLNVTAR